MTLAEPLPELASHDGDDESLPTCEQQALAEKRLAEMLADPSLGESFESFDAFLANLTA